MMRLRHLALLLPLLVAAPAFAQAGLDVPRLVDDQIAAAERLTVDELLAEEAPTVPVRLREFLPALVAGEIPDEPIDITPPPEQGGRVTG